MKIIGLTGAAGSGKSTFADRLVAAHGYTTYSFASPLKDLCAELFGWDRSRLDELAYKEAVSGHVPPAWDYWKVQRFWDDQIPLLTNAIGLTDFGLKLASIHPSWTRRQILQFVGTEIFRAEDPDFWVKKGKKFLQAELDRKASANAGGYGIAIHNIVIPDVRFENEARVIRELGGIIVRIERDGQFGTASKAHASEQEWSRIPADKVIKPANGVENVKRAADRLISPVPEPIERRAKPVDPFGRRVRWTYGSGIRRKTSGNTGRRTGDLAYANLPQGSNRRAKGRQDRRTNRPPGTTGDGVVSWRSFEVFGRRPNEQDWTILPKLERRSQPPDRRVLQARDYGAHRRTGYGRRNVEFKYTALRFENRRSGERRHTRWDRNHVMQRRIEIVRGRRHGDDNYSDYDKAERRSGSVRGRRVMPPCGGGRRNPGGRGRRGQ